MLAIGSLLGLVSYSFAVAQDRSTLPISAPEFSGKLAPSLDASKSFWPDLIKAPEGAPNVILVLTDDVGFGAASTFGGPVPTPNLDRLARSGAVYNNFHTTAMCSPTRASLLTGRNHHAVGTGALTNVTMGFPGYDGILPLQSATIGRILRDNGFSTAWIGKHHNVPNEETGETGPFTHWPTNLGFEEFYGFLGSESDQFYPVLQHGTNRVAIESRNNEVILDKDFVDHAILWLRRQDAAAPDKPFFLYFAPGTAHAPHQAPPEWITRFKGKFDAGWDKLREGTYQRQLKMGLIPAKTKMTPRPREIPAWDSLSSDQKRLYARYMEVFAAMLTYQDAQFGRLLDELEASGDLDNTLIIFIEGDNGGSAEGGPEGSLNELMTVIGQKDQSFDEQLRNIDKLGGPDTYQVYPAGWTWATNTPFPLYKQIGSHLGGTRNGLVISWPGHIDKLGHLRSQFHHVIDIAPTILEAVKVPQPKLVDGVRQDPFDGMSMSYTFTKPKAKSARKTQYFELLGNRAIYQDGWMASTNPGRMPWQPISSSSPEEFTWSLYHLDTDFAQAHDVAQQYPEKLKTLKKLFDEEARKYDVYPLRADLDAVQSAKLRRPKERRSEYVYRGNDIHIAWSEQPMLLGAFSINVQYSGNGPLNGALLATGSALSGWAFAIEDGFPIVKHSASSASTDQYVIRASRPLSQNKGNVAFRFRPDGPQRFSPGTVSIVANDQVIGSGRIERIGFLTMGPGESFDIGNDTGRLVMSYPKGPAFSGSIDRLLLKLGQ